MNPIYKDSTKVNAEVSQHVKKFKCPQCNECFRYRRHYDKHMEGHKQNNCKYCDKLFTVRKKLAIHLHDEHNIALKVSKHCCQYCDRSFVKKLSLYQHYHIHAEGKYVCLCCGMFFNELNEYAKHQEKHKYEKPYKCDKCDEKFSRRQQYLLHVKGHEKYKCLTCKEGFSAQFKLNEHKRKGHEIKELEATYVCGKCRRTFHLQRALVLHQRVHKGEDSFKCTDCGKNFTSRKSYSKHLNSVTHRGRKEKNTVKLGIFICDVCGKICREKHALSLHVTRVHSKEEPKKCSFCDYKSTSKANLKRHMEFHTEDRKFICECCGASFYMLCTLKEHCLYVHSEERNFQCPKCDKSFKRRCGLNRHLQNHSESRPYKCYCGQTYKRMSHLKRHKESSHGLISQSSSLCRLRCDDSGVLVPVVEEGGTKSKKRTSMNVKTTSKDVATKEDDGTVKLQLTSCDSYTAEDAKLVLSGIQGGGSIPCSVIPNIHIELNVSNPSISSKHSDDLRLQKVTSRLTCLLPDNSFMSQKVCSPLSQVETIVPTRVNLPLSILSDVPVKCSSNEKSDCVQNTFQGVTGNSHDLVVSDSSHTDLVHFIQDSHGGIPVMDLVQVVAPEDALADNTMVLLCLSSLPVAAADDCC